MSETRGFILGITSSKGGPGKSTIAQNLACEFARQGYSVCIVDADKQNSVLNWANRRANNEDLENAPKVVVKSQEGDLRQSLTDEAKLYDYVLVDVAGKQGPELTSTLIMADIVLVPATASQKDLEVIPKIAQELHDTSMKAADHRKAFGFMNKVDPTAKMSDIIEDREFFNHPAMGGAFGIIKAHLKSFPRAIDRADRFGCGVIEDIKLGTAQQARAKGQVQVLALDIQKEITKIISELAGAA